MRQERENPLPAVVFRDAAMLLLGFVVLYLLLGQDVFYKADGPHLVRRLLDRDPHYAHHKLYMPLLIGFGDLIAPLGLTAYRTAVVFSSLGVGLAIGFVHIGFRALGASRLRAWLASLLVGLCPACVLFGTVVEFHGPFLAFAALAFLEMAFLVRRPNVLGAVFLGVFSSVAAGVHASGLILPGLLLLWFLALRLPSGTWKRDLAFVLVAALVHVGLTRVLAAPDKANDFLAEGFRHPQGIEHLPRVLWDEWLWAFPPVSFLVFCALARPKLRLQAVACTVAAAPYVYGALRLLVGEKEFGAYLLPLAIPAAWLTTHALPRPALWLAIVVSAGLAFFQVQDLDRSETYREYVSGMRAATGGRPALLLIGHGREVGPILVYAPDTQIFPLDLVAKEPPAVIAGALPMFDERVRQQRAEGREVFLTEDGERYLANPVPGLTDSGPILLAHIRRTYRLEEVQAPGFRGWRLTPK